MAKKAMTASEMGRKGGLNRAAKMTKKQRAAAARLAANARWHPKGKRYWQRSCIHTS